MNVKFLYYPTYLAYIAETAQYSFVFSFYFYGEISLHLNEKNYDDETGQKEGWNTNNTSNLSRKILM